MLYCGERIGDGRRALLAFAALSAALSGSPTSRLRLARRSLPRVDIAVDPLDGTTACATGRSGAVAVIALAERGALFDPGPAFYMVRRTARALAASGSARTPTACALTRTLQPCRKSSPSGRLRLV